VKFAEKKPQGEGQGAIKEGLLVGVGEREPRKLLDFLSQIYKELG